MSLEQRVKLMQIVSFSVGGYAFLWALAPYEAINGPARFILNLSAGSLGGLFEPLNLHAQWLSSIGAGLLMAVAIISYGVIAPAIRQVNPQDAQIIRFFKLAIIAWYLIDSLGSIAAGVVVNVLFNTVFLGLIFLPLLRLKTLDPSH
ncbi:hypothetical protein [uncultured Thiothrix sp.]|uniref:hypothetical protein n=1 Tax=uncultured Thiothrix sp. TaxID=223185 RepID=UPI00261C4C04|nr:hypothetical protein [uncultured Thiothrix sp.]